MITRTKKTAGQRESELALRKANSAPYIRTCCDRCGAKVRLDSIIRKHGQNICLVCADDETEASP